MQIYTVLIKAHRLLPAAISRKISRTCPPKAAKAFHLDKKVYPPKLNRGNKSKLQRRKINLEYAGGVF
jgi:hypothetical protein